MIFSQIKKLVDRLPLLVIASMQFVLLPPACFATDYDKIVVPAEPPPVRGNYAPDAVGLGWIAFENGNHKQALTFFKWQIQYHPDEPHAYFGVAYVYSIEGRLDEAIRFYRESLQRDSKHADTYANLGYALLRQRQSTEGLQMLDQAIKLTPGCGAAYLSYSLYYGNQEKWKEAGEYANEAIDRGVKIPSAYVKRLRKHKVRVNEPTSLQ